MPYIPRRFGPTSGVRPDLTPAVPVKKPPVPSRGEEAVEGLSQNEMLPYLSPRTYEVSILHVFKQLFGKEFERDERTGELVQRK